jgi:hypothetical protein
MGRPTFKIDPVRLRALREEQGLTQSRNRQKSGNTWENQIRNLLLVIIRESRKTGENAPGKTGKSSGGGRGNNPVKGK